MATDKCIGELQALSSVLDAENALLSVLLELMDKNKLDSNLIHRLYAGHFQMFLVP